MTSYSDYDSDGYSSNDDVDYVPSDDNLSEDDLSQCEKEDPLDEGDVVPHGHEGTTVATKKKKKKGQDITMRKRKKGGLKLEGEEKEGDAEDEEEKKKEEEEEETDEGRTTNVSRKEEEASSGRQKKADDLWASFLSDVGSRPKPSSCTPSPPSSGARQVDTSVSKGSLSSSEPTARSSEPSKVTITKVFDFAGEEVRVTKEVSADSREAKTYLKSQSTEPGEDQDRAPAPDKPLPPGPSANKRPAGMSSLLNRLGGKKQKMSTLEKSKMDWDAFKSEEGITEELAIHNRGKEGYVERKNFLERVDHRQFEREKAVRLTHMKPPT